MCGTLSGRAGEGGGLGRAAKPPPPQLGAVLGQRRTPELAGGRRHAVSATAQECSGLLEQFWTLGAERSAPKGGGLMKEHYECRQLPPIEHPLEGQ